MNYSALVCVFFRAPLRAITLLIWLAILTACGGGGGSDSTNPNACGAGDCSPQAAISTPTVTVYAGQTVQLDGSSSKPSGEISYHWLQTEGETVVLSGADEAIAQFVVPTFGTEQTLGFKLVVTNGFSDNAEEISFVVKPLTVTATASTDTAIPGTPTELRAVGGNDSGELQYQWEQIDVGDVKLLIEDANSAIARITSRIVIAATTATFRVSVTNKYNATAQSEITINLAEGVIPSITAVTPSYAAVGEEVKISGSGFTGASGVNFIRNGNTTFYALNRNDTRMSDHSVWIKIPTNIEPGDFEIEIQNSGGFDRSELQIRNALSDIDFVSAGTVHMCAAFGSNAAVKCWGKNGNGQLGNNSDIDSTTPVAVLKDNGEILQGATALSSGEIFSCALVDTKVYCWGANGTGQLGIGTTQDSPVAKKVLLPDTASIVAIAAGSYVHCALDSTGKIYCWGANTTGQFTGAEGYAAEPVQLQNVPAASSIAVGSDHACAIAKSDGTVWCWGKNAHGELGDGTLVDRNIPEAVALNSSTRLTGATKISVGASYSCARLSTGSVSCWGINSHGQLGNGSAENSAVPTPVLDSTGNSPLAGIVSIASGHSHAGITGGAGHSCALTNLGVMYCWGKNQYGQLGNGSIEDSKTPVMVSAVSNVSSITLGTSNTCALRTDKTLLCWGLNANGQLGYSNFSEFAHAVSVDNLNDVIQVSSGRSALYSSDHGFGQDFNCALTADGTVYCWGHNYNGQLGRGSFIDSYKPLPVGGLRDVASISTGGAHSCAISNYRVYCWGANDHSQLGSAGIDSLTSSASPVLVDSITDARIVSAGTALSCAATTKEDIWCWGNDNSAPTKITEFDSEHKIISLAAGVHHACALIENGNVYCWGVNDKGQLGNGTTVTNFVPTRVGLPLNSPAKNIDVGVTHSCATLADGKIYCWGGNEQGQLGPTTTTSFTSTPQEVGDVSAAKSVSAGGLFLVFTPYSYTCALNAENNGSVSCWGDNELNQTGGLINSSQTSPTTIDGLVGIKQISAGGAHSCALYNDGNVACWGGVSAGQLGQPPLTPRMVLN